MTETGQIKEAYKMKMIFMGRKKYAADLLQWTFEKLAGGG